MTFAAIARRVDWILVGTVLLLLVIGEQAVKTATVNDLEIGRAHV